MLTDMGSETGRLAAVHATLRYVACFGAFSYYPLLIKISLHFCPGLTFEELPPHIFVKSVFNITREHSWKPLFYTELENILVAWREGPEAGYQPHNAIHTCV